MQTKTINNLLTIQQAAAEIIISHDLESEDEKAIRFLLHVIPGILARVEGRPVMPEKWDNCDGL